MATDQPMGQRIAAARDTAQLTQRALAAELGVSVRTIQNYEAGRFIPYRRLDALSSVLHCQPAWLLFGDPRFDVRRAVADVRQQLAETRQQRTTLRSNVKRLREHREVLIRRREQRALNSSA